jgi:putative aldouronate transport system substrate-binding protein
MAEDPTVWYPYLKDGKKYGLPVLDYTGNQDPVLWIRQDWLDKLKLKAPTTIAELDQVMDAFVNQDPDGDGKKDTFGLVYSAKNGFNSSNQGDTSWIFGAYGAMPKQWNLVDGQLQYGSVNPAVKDGLAEIKTWLDKGYVPQESGLYTNAQAKQQFLAGKVGIIAGPLWFLNETDLAKATPGAKLKAYPIPTGPDGKAGRTSLRGSNGVILLSKDMKNPEVFFTYWNFFFDNYANPAAGSEFQYGLAQGYDWDMVDGQPTMDRTKVKDWLNPDKYTLTYEGARIPSLQYKTLEKLASGQAPSTPAEQKFALSDPPEWIDAGNIVEQQADISMPDMYQGPSTKTMQTKKDFLDTMELQTFSDIVYGKQPLDAFDDFVKKWTSTGGDQITQEVNDWYKSVTAQ